MKKKVDLKTYRGVLQELSNNSPNHLLLGNGFNSSLGIKTNYASIYSKMKEKYHGYSKVEDVLARHDYDIEILIRELKNKIPKDNFLPQYTERNIKLDFMQATYSIVKKHIKEVYQDRNHGIHLLLKNFTNYFTLNYDPFLYLLLMKFKKDDGHKSHAVAFQGTILFQSEDLNETQGNIYNEIKKARERGKLSIAIEEDKTQKRLSQCTKTEFTDMVKTFFKDKNWGNKDIKKAIDLLWKEEKQYLSLDVNDGFLSDEFRPEWHEIQNLFFLHGAFHIYKDKRCIKKITQTQDKALYRKLEEIIDEEEKDIVCVFTGTAEEKKEHIGNDEYLTTCFEKLSALTGSLVIFGSSLSENDAHIFEKINQSQISSIYISSNEEKKNDDYRKAADRFLNKEVFLFDYTTISYEEV